MADVKTCDRSGCKNIGQAPFEGWLHVNREDEGWLGVRLGDSTGPWDLCSYECLALWAAEQMKKGHRRGSAPTDTST